MSQVLIPAQIRAARALISWSQDDLAEAAAIAVSSVRDIESQKRAPDTGAVTAIREALENEGVVFLPGRKDEGPGVRLAANRPNIVRLPTTMTMWDGMPFTVEWKGRAVTVLVSQDALEDLGGLTKEANEDVYLRIFHKHRGHILDGVARAIVDKSNFDRHGRLYVRGKDIPTLT
jgi:transcriptional regulator with XRE-family HTH domain